MFEDWNPISPMGRKIKAWFLENPNTGILIKEMAEKLRSSRSKTGNLLAQYRHGGYLVQPGGRGTRYYLREEDVYEAESGGYYESADWALLVAAIELRIKDIKTNYER